MKYYVVNSVLQGIQYKKLEPGKDATGTVAYFINLESKNEQDEYYDAENVFSDYTAALRYFCKKCDESIKCHQAQILAIKSIKDCVLS